MLPPLPPAPSPPPPPLPPTPLLPAAPEQPDPLDVTCLGQMANDLAMDAAASAASKRESDRLYDAASRDANLLVLVFRLERDEHLPHLLLPTRPISTLSRSITCVHHHR